MIKKHTKTLYHGTISQYKNSIINNGFIPGNREDDYLGMGVYFYDKQNDALVWGEKKAKYYQDSPVVFKSVIIIKDETFLDLTALSGKKHCIASFKKFGSKFNQDITIRQSIVHPRKKIAVKASLLINAYCEKYGIDMVKAELEVNDSVFCLSLGIITKREIQYSLRNVANIKSNQVVYEDERSKGYEVL